MLRGDALTCTTPRPVVGPRRAAAAGRGIPTEGLESRREIGQISIRHRACEGPRRRRRTRDSFDGLHGRWTRRSPKETEMLREDPTQTHATPINPYRESALPTCKCGTNRTHRAATPERQYTFMGTLYALWGGTSVPSIVEFRCVHCGVIFDACSDVATRQGVHHLRAGRKRRRAPSAVEAVEPEPGTPAGHPLEKRSRPWQESIMPLTDRQRADFDRLVRSKPVVLFMKGNRHFPACGFSATVVGILDKLATGYETVNILEDPQVREGMKEFSSWPTFPQLYVKGEFVGGCDIVKEMYASGELAEAPRGPSRRRRPRAARSRSRRPRPRRCSTRVGRRGWRRRPSRDRRRVPLRPADRGEGERRLRGDLERRRPLRGARHRPHAPTGSTSTSSRARAGWRSRIDNPNEPPHVKRIGPKELKALLDRGSHPALRRAAGRRARRGFDRPGEGARRGEGEGTLALKRDAAIALHCHHGMRSRAAAEELLREGFTNVYNLEGGIEAWSRDVDPSVPRY